MRRSSDGWFELVREAPAGSRYGFVLEDGMLVPDPAARAQAGDVHAPSLLAGSGTYQWLHDQWRGRPWEEAVITEIHIGTFTPGGTFRAAIERLDHLVATGITAIEIMPVAHFSGSRGWGYDGVLLYAPHPAYGTSEELKALIDEAHGRGLMVLLDVVYNHFGPDGNYLGMYAPEFFHPGRDTPWGAAIAYERGPVRRFFIENALYWIGEFHFDGLRLDAIDHVRDTESPIDILVDIAREVRAAHPERHVHLITEDNRNITRLHERGPGGTVPLYTAEWNDDMHNAAHVLATRETGGYYADFAEDTWRKYARALAEGFAFQGERSTSGERRGAPSGHLPPTAFVDFLQNHDQIGNRAFGERLIALARPQRMMRAFSAILLLSPHVPLMFMGDEWGETRPFAFFTDFRGELAESVREGRRREFQKFVSFDDPTKRARIPDPNAVATFEASRIDWSAPESKTGRRWLKFTRRLLALRHKEVVPLLRDAGGNAGHVLAAHEGTVAIRWRLSGADLYLRANLADRPQTVQPIPGRVIHTTMGNGLESTLPSCSAVFSVAEAETARVT